MHQNSQASDSFYNLGPNEVLTAIEEAGFLPTGEFQQLNSYENRVFDIWLEHESQAGDEKPRRVVAKFYRPGRWSKEAIEDEHQFLLDLKGEGLPAIAPLLLSNEKTLLFVHGLWLAVFPRFAGRMPQEFLAGELKQVGRTLARIHNIGARSEAEHRLHLHPADHGWNLLDEIAERVDQQLWSRYENSASDILDFLEDRLSPQQFTRIHGDCHRGNLLHNGEEFFFVDFDDFCNGPAAQDFWMLFSGDEQSDDIDEILSGYSELRSFAPGDFELFEPLRGLRIIHTAAWIHRRWSDPSFPKLFPQYGEYSYWAEEVEALEAIAWKLN